MIVPGIFQIQLRSNILYYTGLLLFPNPTSGLFTLSVEEAQGEEIIFKMYDAAGRAVYRAELECYTIRKI